MLGECGFSPEPKRRYISLDFCEGLFWSKKCKELQNYTGIKMELYEEAHVLESSTLGSITIRSTKGVHEKVWIAPKCNVTV